MTIATYPTADSTKARQILLTKEMLDRAEAYEVLDYVCDTRTRSANEGNSVTLSRWINPAINTDPEPEGQNPVTRALSPEEFTGTLKRYSVAFATSTYNATMDPRDWVKGMADITADQVKMVRERIRWMAALDTTNTIYNSASISQRSDVNGTISLGRLQKAIAGIRAAKGRELTAEGMGTNKVGSSPVEAGYVCYTHTNAEPDIRILPGFTKKAEMSPGNYPKGTFGCVDNVIFVTSPELVPYEGEGAATSTLLATDGNADVYPFVVCAKGSLASIKFAGKERGGFGNGQAHILDKPDKSDITNSRIVVSAAWYDLAMSVSDDWRVVIECGVTANPA
jgi:N4-gp56 family major capsid protein